MPSTLYLLAIVYVRCVAQPHELRRYINSGVLENYYTQTTTLKVLFSPTNMDCLTCTNFLGFTIGHIVLQIYNCVAEKLEFEMLMQVGLNNK
jgi:hypothetical protein